MKVNSLLRVLPLMTILGLASCEKDSDVERHKGDIAGKVRLFDVHRDEISDRSGVTVEALIGDQKFTTTTNATGEFTFRQIPTGDYIINFRKENFGGFDSLKFDHLNAVDSLLFAKLAEVPQGSTTVDFIRTEHQPNINSYWVYPYTSIVYATEEWVVASKWLYFSKDPAVSSTNFMYRAVECCLGGNSSYPSSAAQAIDVKTFYQNGFASGDKVYIASYLGNQMLLRYSNQAKGYDRYIFPAHGTARSNVKSFILP
ncbi:hypothetical protein CLV24_11217 [Pontibacter ummariensis]|uniref:Carboxypeptidase regulatory-like domain-containing protein n=1 Tax=Pontibacter ummariensis TaxID=1610492 RepID=A0A239H4S9_9BACT|nr:carboxypeptidase-like regulatory domain-containing protein [Pontibacter ummariensis]PRY10890.1 hypothetical protein CLV24_11217 [Pontibacter ummariensis]SNS76155.1 hypothetical protein SAMN06296052_112161 [Pontibacter ummariensis]